MDNTHSLIHPLWLHYYCTSEKRGGEPAKCRLDDQRIYFSWLETNKLTNGAIDVDRGNSLSPISCIPVIPIKLLCAHTVHPFVREIKEQAEAVGYRLLATVACLLTCLLALV
jgi:hypothetical protein